jgi:NADH-quinone oxidoreductase subunit J
MLLGAESLPGITNLRNIWFPGTLAVILFIEATYLLIVKAGPTGDVLQPKATINTMENLRQLGTSLFSDYLLPFEVVSILLLVAMVGAIILTKKEKGVR